MFAKASGCPRDGPFDCAAFVLAFDPSGERFGRHDFEASRALREEVGKTIRKVEDRLLRRLVDGALRRTGPADLNPAEQVGLGSGHAIKPGRFEGAGLSENFLVGREPDERALLLGRRAPFNRPDRLAAAEGLAPLKAVAPDCDVQPIRQRIHD